MNQKVIKLIRKYINFSSMSDYFKHDNYLKEKRRYKKMNWIERTEHNRNLKVVLSKDGK